MNRILPGPSRFFTTSKKSKKKKSLPASRRGRRVADCTKGAKKEREGKMSICVKGPARNLIHGGVVVVQKYKSTHTHIHKTSPPTTLMDLFL